MRMPWKIGGLIATMALCTSVQALVVTEQLLWSGAPFGNSAQAVGQLTFDTDLFGGGLHSVALPDPGVIAFTLVVTGATRGNGTFTLADFDALYLGAPGALDFTRELVGQPLPNGLSFGTSSGSGDLAGHGDFNFLSSSPGVPTGTWYFGLNTSGGLGDPMYIRSITPVPEPGSALLLAGGLGGLGVVLRRAGRRRPAASGGTPGRLPQSAVAEEDGAGRCTGVN